jgi:hypothetical protein
MSFSGMEKIRVENSNEKEESLSVPALSCTRLFQGLDLVDAG